MTALSRTRVTCDAEGCQAAAETEYGERDPATLRARLERMGWVIAPQYRAAPDYCPEHRP